MTTLKLNPAGKDFFIRILIEHGWRRVYFILGIFLFIALIPILLSIPAGNFINSSLKIDALRDIGYYDQFFILLPFFIIFVPYYLNGLPAALISLIESGVVTISEEELKEVEVYSNKLFGNRIVTLLPYLIGVAMVIFDLFTYIIAGENAWNSAKGLANISLFEIITAILAFFEFYIISVLIIRIFLTYFIISKFLSGRVDIQPLHPDNCGGLSPLGEFSLRLSKAGIAVGIPILFGILSNYYQHELPLISFVNILMVGGYILCLSILFFLPLLGARQSMLKAKKEQLKQISDHFNIERKSILRNLSHEKSDKNIEISDLEGLMKLYEIANAMPVFPFNSKNIIRFLSSVLWPILLFIFEYILGK